MIDPNKEINPFLNIIYHVLLCFIILVGSAVIIFSIIITMHLKNNRYEPRAEGTVTELHKEATQICGFPNVKYIQKITR